MAAIIALTGFGGSIYKAASTQKSSNHRGQKNFSKTEGVLSITRVAGGLRQTNRLSLGGQNSPQQDLLPSLA